MTTITNRRSLRTWIVVSATTVFAVGVTLTAYQAAAPKPATPQTAAPAAKATPVVTPIGGQKIDAEYTKKIIENTPDKRILTELIDHMPVSNDPNIPSPLKFLGYVPGENNQLTYHKDIIRYYQALEKASKRVKLWSIGKSEEGREMYAMAIADEATIANLAKYKDITARLTDPRKTNDAVAKQLIATGKPIYYASGSIHTPETGSPEMLTELAYRLVIEETPFIKEIRNNIITVITPASEVDGREKQVDNQRAQQAGQRAPGLAYWGHYVQHDNNRDGIGKGLALTNNMLKSFLDLHPTVFHDLHESVNLLYVSTGTGPYNPNIAPIQTNEWWWLSENEIMEMTKRGVPGVWTYNYYDGWVPNYMFWIGVTHNSIGRFYETQSYGGGNGVTDSTGKVIGTAAANAAAAARPAGAGGGNRGGGGGGGGGTLPANSREWYRPNPSPGDVKWSGRSNINMQQSALLITLNTVAKNKEKFLENYYAKNKQMVEKGRNEAPYAYVVPAKQRRRVEAAEFMNFVKRDGVEVHTASAAFKIGNTDVQPGDYIVRLDQPYGGVVEMLMGVQWYPSSNPRPYDDTGWYSPALRNVTTVRVDDKAIFDKPMSLVTAAEITVPGTIAGTGATIVIDNVADNTLATFAFANKALKMQVAEQAFDMGGHHFAPGAFVITGATRAAVEPQIRQLGLLAWATDAAPTVPMHAVSVPRIGYIHSWQSTQDEGWWRLAFDHLKVPYDYIGDNEVRKGNLKAKYDVILYPQTGGVDITSEGIPAGDPIPYKGTPITPNIATSPGTTDDTRGGLGKDGLKELVKFMNEGGVLIAEGTPARTFTTALTEGVGIHNPDGLYAPGSVLKTMLGDKTSPVLYGYDQKALGVLYNVGPIFNIGASSGAAAAGGGGRGGGALPVGVGGGELQPMGAAPQLTTLDGGAYVPVPGVATAGVGGRGGGAGFGGGAPGGAPAGAPAAAAGAAGGRAGGGAAAAGGGRGAGGGGGRGGGAAAPAAAGGASDLGLGTRGTPRVLLSYPTEANDILLSGEMVGPENLTGRAAVIEQQIGKGHVLLFGVRPFWRYETSGNYFLVFNAMLNWDHLDAGKK